MQKILRRLWVLLWLLTAILLLYPINCRTIRWGIVITALGGLAGFLWTFRQRRIVCLGVISGMLLTAGFLALPGHPCEPPKLREAYLAGLRSYAGTPYLWGGENHFGIDCSGLVRAGLIQANFQSGWRTLNPRLLRFAVSLWWHDCSARELGEAYRGQTRRVLAAPAINALDESRIQPGDLAVTASGVHVLAFLGNHQWIEADPQFHKVVIVDVPAAKNPWFQEPVNVVRWTELETF